MTSKSQYTIYFVLLNYLFCSIRLSIFSSRYPILCLFVKLFSYFIAFNCLHLYLDSPILCMPNYDWDPSVHTGVPVETVQSFFFDFFHIE